MPCALKKSEHRASGTAETTWLPCRYVYIPAGGSRHGLLGTLLSTALTFAFVSFWHGGHADLWCWAALNWLGVTAEGAVRKLAETPRVQHCLVSGSPAGMEGDSPRLLARWSNLCVLRNGVPVRRTQCGVRHWAKLPHPRVKAKPLGLTHPTFSPGPSSLISPSLTDLSPVMAL